MTIIIGWNNSRSLYMLNVYVPAHNNVHVNVSAPMQVVYFIQLMKEHHIIHIGWDHTMIEEIKSNLIALFREHIKMAV